MTVVRGELLLPDKPNLGSRVDAARVTGSVGDAQAKPNLGRRVSPGSRVDDAAREAGVGGVDGPRREQQVRTHHDRPSRWYGEGRRKEGAGLVPAGSRGWMARSLHPPFDDRLRDGFVLVFILD